MTNRESEGDVFLESSKKGNTQKVEGGNSSSLTTILAIWNCIMGSSLLSMPWAFEKAGFAQTIFIMIFSGVTCYYTAYLCIKAAEKALGKSEKTKGPQLPEFQAVCHYYLGPWGERAALLAADVIVLGALTVYYVLMSKFLFGFGMSVYELKNMDKNTTVKPFVDDLTCVNWMEYGNATGIGEEAVSNGNAVDLKASFSDYYHVNKSIPLYILFVLILCCIKDVSFFNRASAAGAFTVFAIFFAAFWKAGFWGISDNVSFQFEPNGKNSDNMHYIKQFDVVGTGALPGILSMAYFIHSAVTTMMRDNKDQSKNARDLGIAYFLVFATYTILGLVFYLAYPGWKGCITDMFIDNFDKREWIAPTMHILMFFRILSIYPLLTYFIRVQNFSLFLGTEWPGYTKVFIVNACIVAVGCCCAMFYDKIGDVIRYAGSFCAMIYMYFLPCIVKLIQQKEELGVESYLKLPIWSLIVHCLLIVLGVLLFIFQFLINPYDMESISSAYHVTETT
jgi:sodium-coupled neutral amino acid transporter 9